MSSKSIDRHRDRFAHRASGGRPRAGCPRSALPRLPSPCRSRRWSRRPRAARWPPARRHLPRPAPSARTRTTYRSASLSNAARSPWRCKRSNSASQARTESLVSTSLSMPSSSCAAGIQPPGRWRTGARHSPARRTVPGFACATSIDACAGAHWARLAPVTVTSPPAGSMCLRAPLPPACAASARADAARGRHRASACRAFSWPVVLKRKPSLDQVVVSRPWKRSFCRRGGGPWQARHVMPPDPVANR